MKRILAVALTTGFLAVPSVALAHRSGDDSSTAAGTASASVRQEHAQLTSSLTSAQTGTPAQSVNDDDNVTLPTTGISTDEAKSIAQTAFPNKTIMKVEMEQEEGVAVFSVRFTDGSRVDVNATDGSIVRQRDRAAEVNNNVENDNDNDNENEVADDNGGANETEHHQGSNSGSSNSGSGHSGRDHSEDD